MADESMLNAIAVLVGPTIAITVGNIINYRAARSAAAAAASAAGAAMAAQQATYQAAGQASEAARQLIITARASDNKLEQISSVSSATHTIVNNQRTEMVEKIESLKAELGQMQARIDAFQK